MANKNPRQTKQADEDISQILNPKKNWKDIYKQRQKDILKDVFQ